MSHDETPFDFRGVRGVQLNVDRKCCDCFHCEGHPPRFLEVYLFGVQDDGCPSCDENLNSQGIPFVCELQPLYFHNILEAHPETGEQISVRYVKFCNWVYTFDPFFCTTQGLHEYREISVFYARAINNAWRLQVNVNYGPRNAGSGLTFLKFLEVNEKPRCWDLKTQQVLPFDGIGGVAFGICDVDPSGFALVQAIEA